MPYSGLINGKPGLDEEEISFIIDKKVMIMIIVVIRQHYSSTRMDYTKLIVGILN